MNCEQTWQCDKTHTLNPFPNYLFLLLVDPLKKFSLVFPSQITVKHMFCFLNIYKHYVFPQIFLMWQSLNGHYNWLSSFSKHKLWKIFKYLSAPFHNFQVKRYNYAVSVGQHSASRLSLQNTRFHKMLDEHINYHTSKGASRLHIDTSICLLEVVLLNIGQDSLQELKMCTKLSTQDHLLQREGKGWCHSYWSQRALDLDNCLHKTISSTKRLLVQRWRGYIHEYQAWQDWERWSCRCHSESEVQRDSLYCMSLTGDNKNWNTAAALHASMFINRHMNVMDTVFYCL